MTRELMLWILLSACSYRITRLIVKDTFPPVLWLRDRLAGGWRPLTSGELAVWWAGAPYKSDGPGSTIDHPELGAVQIINGEQNRYVKRVSWSPHWLSELIACPWCASAYVSGALVAATDLTVGVPWPWIMAGAVWASSSLLASRTWA